MSGSVHSKLNRVRKPRVHISYEVETDGAQIERELPFVVGVMGDFSGDPTQPLKPIADRKFASIDRDNFNDVMARMAPGLNLKVDNKLADDGSVMAVNLKFNSMDDFDPARVVDQVPALRSLLETRNKLRDLMSKADRSDELEGLLEKVLQNKAEGGLINVRYRNPSLSFRRHHHHRRPELSRSGRFGDQTDGAGSRTGLSEEPGRAGPRRHNHF
jgi:type VI secretion system protein ImpB